MKPCAKPSSPALVQFSLSMRPFDEDARKAIDQEKLWLISPCS
jgi:hypothetical protein